MVALYRAHGSISAGAWPVKFCVSPSSQENPRLSPPSLDIGRKVFENTIILIFLFPLITFQGLFRLLRKVGFTFLDLGTVSQTVEYYF